MKGSLIVVGFFILGLVAGRMDALPAWMAEGGLSFVALCGLLLCVGMSIGLNPDMKSDFKSLNPRLALLPIATILGSWVGAMVAFAIMLGGDGGIIQPRGLTDCLAIDSGFAYYSLSSIFITEYRSADQYHPRDDYAADDATDGEVVWSAGAAILGWRHDDGHHAAHHHPDDRPALCGAEHLPRLCHRLLRALPRDHVVHAGGLSLGDCG